MRLDAGRGIPGTGPGGVTSPVEGPVSIDPEVLETIYRNKEARRRQPRLPFHEKIEILIAMQKRADGILRSRGQPGRIVWKLPSRS